MKLFVTLATLLMTASAMADLVLYTDRPAARMQAIADMYKAAGGETVQVMEMPYADILMKAQEPNSDADVIFVKDGVFLQELKQNNLLAPMNSAVLAANVQPALRDSDNAWTFITARARTLVYDDSVDVSGINTYADLADPQWAGTLCLRSGKNSYNVALISAFIADYGTEDARSIVSGWLANRVTPTVFPNDTAILNAIANGECTFGITNSYYLGALLSQQPNLPLKIKFLSMKSGGVHMNGTGAGVAASSKQKEQAQAFIEFMATNDDVQLTLTSAHFDFPVKTGLAPNTLVKDFGTYTPTATNWSAIGAKTQEAIDMAAELAYE